MSPRTSRSGAELTVNMIILIALGIVILIIAILMVSNTSKAGKEKTDSTLTNNCEMLGGVCSPIVKDGDKIDNGKSCPTGTTGGSRNYLASCKNPDQICCSAKTP
jgi:hypothetical protein